MLKTCPNCGVKAIPVNGEKPKDSVECSNCQARYLLKDLKK
jgi:DNA-directed RNA polymerase subunit RPC12/RpoP